jgi:large subunit ribosomal protein L15
MMIHEISNKVEPYKTRKRCGRGRSSGLGKTSGRGHKGAGSRSGYSRRPHFEGGQISFIRRLPKRGFTNAPFKMEYHVVNLRMLESRLENGATVTAESLVEAGLIRDTNQPVKILGDGELTKKFKITAAKCSASAREKIERAGGTLTLTAAKAVWKREQPEKAKKAGKGKSKES